MLAFSAGALAEPNPTAPPGQAPSPADIKPGSLELDPNAPVTGTGSSTPSTGLGSSRPDYGSTPPSSAPAPTAPKTGTAPSAPSKSNAAKAPSTGNGSNILVNIDKSTQEMTVFVDGIERHSWPVSTGTRGYSTPSGDYTARSMNEIWYSKQWDDAPMPHAVFFTKRGHAIHGTTEVKRLGRPASHGCVRLAPENAKTLFYLVKDAGLENTQVVLTGMTPGGEGPAVASGTPPKQYRVPRGYNPWFERPMPPQPYAEPRRRGLFGFGRRNRNNAQGYYGPRYQYQPPRGLGPRGGYGY
ncbi:L,D-transpeptidase family protein [Methyloceanibacter sp.]|uniref:L,D-transpeptidase n=1 Tax=Methyloceanibacter sp. TaxID=1965321 RepID=UPI00351B9D71